MANLGGTFDANNVQPSAPMELLPPGRYIAQITESEMKDNKAGNGQMLKLTFEIIDGPATNRKLWANLNLVNPSTQAVEIAQRDLSAICHAVGKLQVNDSEELHFKPLALTVKVKPAGNDKHGIWREAQNEIGGYAPAGGAAAAPAFQPQRQAPANQPPQQQARPTAAPPPWRRTA